MTDEQRYALAEFIEAAVLVNYHGPVRGDQWTKLADAQAALQVAFAVVAWDLPRAVTKTDRTAAEPKA